MDCLVARSEIHTHASVIFRRQRDACVRNPLVLWQFRHSPSASIARMTLLVASRSNLLIGIGGFSRFYAGIYNKEWA